MPTIILVKIGRKIAACCISSILQQNYCELIAARKGRQAGVKGKCSEGSGNVEVYSLLIDKQKWYGGDLATDKKW